MLSGTFSAGLDGGAAGLKQPLRSLWASRAWLFFAENGVIALLFLPGRGGERGSFGDLWQALRAASAPSEVEIACRGVLYSIVAGQNAR